MSDYVLQLNKAAQEMGQPTFIVHAIIKLSNDRNIYLITLPQDMVHLRNELRGFISSHVKAKALAPFYSFHSVTTDGFELTYAENKEYEARGSEVKGRKDLLWINPKQNEYVRLLKTSEMNNETYAQLLEEE